MTEDARWLITILPKDLQAFFRSEVLAELDRKAAREDGTVDRIKLRKIFYALGKTGKAIFGDQYESTKRTIDVASKAAIGGEVVKHEREIRQRGFRRAFLLKSGDSCSCSVERNSITKGLEKLVDGDLECARAT